MKLNSFFYLTAVTVLFILESASPSYAVQTGNKRSRSDGTNWGQGVAGDSKFELLRSLPPDIFKDVMGDLVEQNQACTSRTCNRFRESEDSYRVQAKRNALVVPADKQYRNLRSFIKYLYKYNRIKLPAASHSSRNNAGDSKSTENGSKSKTNDIGSFVTQINLGLLQPELPSKAGAAPDASVGDVLKAIQTIFPDLRELRLANFDLLESDLEIIGQMKNLRVLDLSGTSFYHEGIQHLSNLTELRKLNVSAPGVAPTNFNPAAQFLHLSKMHHLIYVDFTQTPQTARAFQEWILSITDANNVFAIYRRALMLEYGTDDHKGPPVDSKLAIATYEKAAELGHPLAQTRLARFYKTGIGVKKDHTQAYAWFKKAYLQGYGGDEVACWETRFSSLTPQELTLKHASLLLQPEPARGSRKEHFSYQAELGFMYAEGHGVTKNVDQGKFWLRKAAEKDHSIAQLALGTALLGSRSVKDHAQALKWIQKAAEQGLANAQFILGGLYHQGRGISQDHFQAAEWYQKAAEQDMPDAQNNLGMVYYEGLGVAQDPAQAMKWIQKAAEQGSPVAQYNLSVRYSSGNGVNQDPVRAIEWCRTAATNGWVSAQYSLGKQYEEGLGGNPDIEEAIQWYRLAAAQGHQEAQARLSVLENEANAEAL